MYLGVTIRKGNLPNLSYISGLVGMLLLEIIRGLGEKSQSRPSFLQTETATEMLEGKNLKDTRAQWIYSVHQD